MKIRLTSLQLVALIGFLVIGLLGGGGFYYVSTLEDQATAELQTKSKKRDELQQASVQPSEVNIKTLTENAAQMRLILEALTGRLKSGNDILDAVNLNGSIGFQKELTMMQKNLAELAQNEKVEIPQNFSFGFSRYKTLVPSEKDIPFLNRQRIAINELVRLLVQAHILKLMVIQRTWDDVSDGRSATTAYDAKGERLAGSSIQVADGVYTVYPFLIEFLGKPVAFREFINKLNESPYIFIIRSVLVKNTQPASPRKDDLARQSESSVGTDSDPNAPRAPLYALGFENIDVTVRVDLVEWNGQEKTQASTSPSVPNRP